MKLSLRREILALALLALMAAVAIHYYAILPARIPSRFNAHGKPDEWTNKTAFFLMWGVYLVVPYVVATLFPFFDPLREKIGSRLKVILLIRDLLLVTFAALFVVNMTMAAQGDFRFDWLGIGIGMFLIIYGNYMPKIPRNWSIGMKNQWSLTSEIVWKKTQILGGWLIAATGVAFVVFTMLGLSITIPMLSIIPIMAIVRLYSYMVYRRIGKTQTAQS